MSMQNETKRRSPSIIARLMGLDGLPPQSSSHKQAKSVENQQCRPITSEKACGKKAYGDLRGSMEEQKFKDVFEVFDVEKEKSDRCLYQRRVDANLSEAEMAFIRQKFMEAKRLSADEKLQYSKEFIETLGALDSNKDLLLNFIQHPDSLFNNHLPGLQSIDPKPNSSQAATLQLLNSPNHVENFGTLRVDRELLGKSHKSPQCRGGGANPSHYNSRCDDTINLSSKNQLKKRCGFKLTEIVVLKPNLGKPQTTSRTLPSQSSSCDEVRAYRRLPCTRNQESKAFGSLKANEDSRAIARIVSKQMKESCGSDSPLNFEISRFRGYSADESSSMSDSSSESKLTSVISRARTDFNRNNNHPSLPFRSSESSESKEAMKRLSDRGNLSYKSEKEIEIRRSNTLAEMFATSDREVRKEIYNGITFKRFERNGGQPELLEPIGISSRYGWRNTDKKDLSKSRTIMHQDRTCGYMIVLPKKLTTRDGLVKWRSSYNREIFLSDNSMPVSTNSHMSYNSSSEISRPSSRKVHHMDGELSNEKLPRFKTQRSLSVHADSDTENGSDSEEAKTTLSVEPPDLSALTLLTNVDISGMPTEEVDQSSIPKLHSLKSAKEGDQPSPVPILPTSFHGTEFSSSSCFESLSADLQGLRMRLQILRIESATDNRGSMLVPSNEDADHEESSLVTNETLTIREPGEDWKSLYLADVLANSSFSELNPKSFMATWYSSESPADPSLFEDLEKKYSWLKTSTRLERKFLFDMINSEILEIFKQFTDLQPTKVCPKWDINRIQETLGELIIEKYMKPSRDIEKEVLHWPNLKDDINEVIGKEIEEMLTDELIAELVVREIS